MSASQIEDVARRLFNALACHDRRRFDDLTLALANHPRDERNEVERRLHAMLGIRQEPARP